jgi:hypothetical protein
VWSSKPVIYVILFTTLYRLVSNIATPFLVPYMTKELHFNLIQYAWLVAVPFIGRSIMFSRWGETMRSHSPLIVLQICMLLSASICFGWSQVRSVAGLGSLEFVSGISWGGFELASILLMQSFRPGSARTLIGFHLALQNLAAIGGALFGSYLFSKGFSSPAVIQTSSALRFSVLILFIAVSYQIHTPKAHLRQLQDCLISVYRQFVR